VSLHTTCAKKLANEQKIKSWLTLTEKAHFLAIVQTHAEITQGLLDFAEPDGLGSDTLPNVRCCSAIYLFGAKAAGLASDTMVGRSSHHNDQ
jgi:hypothetical protein